MGRDAERTAREVRVGFHTFRHTCATLLITDEKWSLEQVQVYLGHADYATTRKYYVHLVPKDLPVRASIRTLQGGNRVATGPTEMTRDAEPAKAVESA